MVLELSFVVRRLGSCVAVSVVVSPLFFGGGLVLPTFGDRCRFFIVLLDVVLDTVGVIVVIVIRGLITPRSVIVTCEDLRPIETVQLDRKYQLPILLVKFVVNRSCPTFI